MTHAVRSYLARRPAWVEIDLAQLRRNFELINEEKSGALRVMSVIKDEAYGHGAVAVARVAEACGVSAFAVATLDEGVALRDNGITRPILLLGERSTEEVSFCLEYGLTLSVAVAETVAELGRLSLDAGKQTPVHLKIDTGMNRYGVRWNEADRWITLIRKHPALKLEGVMSHFAMSDEADKTFARVQLARCREVLDKLAKWDLAPCRHLCNSGGFLDLPEAHFDMVRLGILPLGVYPSAVCRRIPGIAPVMTVKARLAMLRDIEAGDAVGYGMRYTATSRRRLAVVPVGYGDGYPRVRNEGSVLIHGQRAPIVGGVAMDNFFVDVTDISQVQPWDEAVLMGRDGEEEITAHDIARLKRSVSYEALVGWRARLPRVCLGE